MLRNVVQEIWMDCELFKILDLFVFFVGIYNDFDICMFGGFVVN